MTSFSSRTPVGRRGVRKRPRPLEDVGEGAAVGVDPEGLLQTGGHRHVEVLRICRDPVHGALLAPELPGDDPHMGAVIVGDLGNIGALDVLVAGRGHLHRSRQVPPELEAVHLPPGVSQRHLLMQDARPRRHPLDRARAQLARVAEAVGVFHGAFEDIGDRLDPPMRVPREALAVEHRVVIAEIVEQQERVELGGVLEPEGAVQVTPAPSMVGCAWRVSRMGRMDMVAGLCGCFIDAKLDGRAAPAIGHRRTGPVHPRRPLAIPRWTG
jgi:hypothetical protein